MTNEPIEIAHDQVVVQEVYGRQAKFRMTLKSGGYVEGMIPNGGSITFLSKGDILSFGLIIDEIDRTLKVVE